MGVGTDVEQHVAAPRGATHTVAADAGHKLVEIGVGQAGEIRLPPAIELIPPGLQLLK